MRKIALLLVLGLLSTSLLVKTQSPTPVPETTGAAGGETTPAPETSAAAGGETTPAAETSAAAGGETTPAPETSAAAGGETTPAPETSAAGAETPAPETTAAGGAAGGETPSPGNTTAGNETAGNATAGNETAGNETAGGGAAGGAGNETVGNETVLELNADQASLVFINFQNGWINENGTAEPNALEDFRRNAQALSALGSIFGLPTYFVGFDNQTYGDWWSILSINNTNASQIWLNESGLALANQEVLSQLEASGRRNVILAALTVDSELVHNAIAAQDAGYKSWAIVDASPYYEPGDYLAGLQNLGVAGIQASTWFALSRFLLNSQPDKMQQVNQLYNEFLTGANINSTASNGGGGGAGGETPAPSESPAPTETPAPGETTMAPVVTTAAPETTAAAGGGRRRRFL